jgi:hypothetical protein
MPLEAYSPGTVTVELGSDPSTTLVVELGTPGPQGIQGEPGQNGTNGTNGQNGVGVPVGGSAGQVLAKIDGTNYNTQWVTKNGGVWGQITGTLSNQTDLQNALNAKYDASNPSGYITVSALAPYLLSSTAASTYLTQSNASSTYLTQANASSTYLTQSNASSTYLTQSNAASTYLTQANASSTYLTISSASATYFPKPTGTTAQYVDGSGALQNFPTVTTAGKMVTSVRNNTGATLTKGTVVYINGAVGNKPTVAKAQANTEVTSKATFAFVEADIANNADGNVVQIGLLENLDTQGFADGTLIYLSPTVAGGWTSTQPFSPNHYVALGTVIRGNHPTLGSIQVRINNGFQLDEMSDVGAVSPTNNNVLTWNAATSQWLDKSISTILGYTPADDSLVLKKASNLSDLQSASVARGNLGLDYATDAQVIAGTSTSVVLNPSNAQQLRPIFDYGPIELGMYSWSTATTGGFFVSAGASMHKFINSQTAVGYGVIYLGLTGNGRTNTAQTTIDFSKKILFSARCGVTNPSNNNTTWRFMVGKSSSSTVAGDLAVRGFGFKRVGTGALQLIVHNGTSLTSVTSSFTPTSSAAFDITFNSDGAGNVIMLVNGNQVASSSAGPTALGVSNGSIFFENENTATTTGSGFVNFQHPRIDLGV